MTFLAYFVILIAIMQLAVALANFIFSQKISGREESGQELVSVLVPARNEEKNIGNLLNDLMGQTYKNIEVLVYDDLSDDGTVEVVTRFSGLDHRISLITGVDLPRDWLGKNHACHHLAGRANGNRFLFLDADVRVESDFIDKISRFARDKEVQLVSIFPVQRMKTAGEWLTVPLMNYILLSLLPLILVRKLTARSLSAANGQCMLFEARTYREMHPHREMKLSTAEDIDISRFFKKSGLRVACLASVPEISCRMYSGYKDALKGFSKNTIHFFGNSWISALFFWGATTLGIIPVLYVFSIEMVMVYLSVIIATRILVSVVSHQNVFLNLLAIVPQQLSLGVIIFQSFWDRYYGSFLWKGRDI